MVASRENMEWDPGAEELKYFAVLWLLVRESAISSDVAVGSMKISSDESFQGWIDRVSSREIEATASVKVQLVDDLEGCLLAKEAAEIRKDLVCRLAAKGLDTDDLDEHLDLWSSLVQKVRSELIPDGSRLPELDIFMSTDFVVLSNQSTRLLTPLHPIRLRWVSSFLREGCDLTSAVFQRSEVFAAKDGSLYLEWLRNRSPRETPPIAVGEDGELLFARSELSWWEDFSKADHSSNNLSFDGHSVDAVIDRIVSYLEAHPHKRDGLAVLILKPSHDFIPARIIEKVSSRMVGPTRMAITVLAPRSRWEVIAKAAEKAPDLTGQSAKVGMFPPIDLSFIDYSQESSIVQLIGGRLFDIAVVTHILENKVVCQPITESPQERPGRYDVLSHRPLRLTTGSIGSMALVLLPTYKDLVLEAWSTMVVRNHRMRPVSPGQPENVDLVELRVNFQDTASVFSELHACCHWVITLERHISREQLESTDAGSPDILSVENGIGENQKNTIIVSSRSGRDLICSKLRRKLRRIVGPKEVVADAQLEVLSTSVYESSRHFSPRLALQALGITRATEEILGLTIARKLVEARMTNAFADGIYVWVSLDEYSRWFGGASYIRADICRFRFEYVGESLSVSVLVVEGKLRQAFDEHGKSQVNRTLGFLREVLRCASDQADGVVDSTMWWEEFARAVE